MLKKRGGGSDIGIHSTASPYITSQCPKSHRTLRESANYDMCNKSENVEIPRSDINGPEKYDEESWNTILGQLPHLSQLYNTEQMTE